MPKIRIAYIVSRFPKVTETFVVRELDAVNALNRFEIALFALFPPPAGPMHANAAPWVEEVRRPSLAGASLALVRWAFRRPWAVLSATAFVIRGFWRSPRLMCASIAAMLVACADAEVMVRMKIEHVHAHFAGHATTAAWVIRRLTGIEYSVTTHAYDLFHDQDCLCERLQAARFVITISQYNAEFLDGYCTDAMPPVSVVRAGVDLTQFRYIERVLPRDGRIRVLCVASLMSHKGHRVLLDSLASEEPDLRRIDVDLVGDGPEASAIKAQVERLSLGHRVHMHGSLPEDRVAEMFDEADIFVLPSLVGSSGRMDGVPVVLMEALACGVPAIASRLSGIPELVEDGVTGTLAEEGDVASLVSALLRVISDPVATAKMARAGRRRVVAEYNVERSATSLAAKFVAAARS
jgi:colanic acid/amylovoran biosynthesis glycosyltransferase